MGKINQQVFYIIILFFTNIFISKSQEIWTLKKCIQRAVEKNISIKQTEADLKITKENKKTAIANFLPNFNIGGAHSWNIGLNQNITTGLFENETMESTSLNATVGLDLFNGLQNIQQLYLANLTILANKYQLEDIKDNVSLLVANAYLQILFGKETLLIRKSQLKIAKEELTITKERVKNGIIPQAYILEIEANIAAIEQNIVIAKNNYLLSKIALAQLLLITDIENFKIAEESYEVPKATILNKNVDLIYKAALKTKNNIKLAQTNLKIAKQNLALSKTSLLPKISGFYSYNSRILFDIPISLNEQLDLNTGQTFGVQLNIPIFNNMANNVAVKKNKINITKTKYALEQIKLDLENTINQAYNDAKGSLKAYEATTKTLLARKLAYDYAKERFENGVINTFNFLESQQKYEAAQSELIKAKYDYIFKIKVLEFYFGNGSIY